MLRPCFKNSSHGPTLPCLQVVRKLADDGDFFELMPAFAKNIVIGFVRMEGHTVGVVGNQPMELAGRYQGECPVVDGNAWVLCVPSFADGWDIICRRMWMDGWTVACVFLALCCLSFPSCRRLPGH